MVHNTSNSIPNWSSSKDKDVTTDGVKKKHVEEEPRKLLDFEDMLPHIGEFGLYQKALFSLMFLASFYLVFVYFTQIFITVVPERHWCKVPELEQLTQEQR